MFIIIIVFVNGYKGIGIRWIIFIFKYNLRDIIVNIRCLFNVESMVFMDLWYMNFKGIIEKIAFKDGGFINIIIGVYEEVDEIIIRITELLIRRWIDDYKNFLEVLKINSNIFYF